MAVNITNRMASPIGIWSDPVAYTVAPAMGGSVENVTPTMSAQAVLDIYVKAGLVTSEAYTPPPEPEE